VKTTQIRLLTTLLDPGLHPAGELAVLYQKRWLIEIGHRCCRSSEIRFS
jgi:IS4 transposase